MSVALLTGVCFVRTRIRLDLIIGYLVFYVACG